VKVSDKWIRNPSDEEAVRQGCFFDISKGEKVRKFIETHCIQSVGNFQGKPLELFDWQINDLIYPLYSWLKPDGTRRFLSCSCWLPKSNGKTTIGASLCLYHTVADGQKVANVVCMATDIEQANCFASVESGKTLLSG
jgi:phage terminase large subunit-like protein